MPAKQHTRPALVKRTGKALKQLDRVSKSAKKPPIPLPDTSRIPWFPDA